MSRPIQLSPDLAEFVYSLVASGRYGSADHVVADALVMLKASETEWDARAADLEADVAEGLADLAAGRAVPAETVFQEARIRLAARSKGQEAAE